MDVKNPNNRQIGGKHYALSAYQHWDYASDLHMRHLEGALTKYLSRAGNKEGEPREKDLEKALHYLEKLIDLYNNDGICSLYDARMNAGLHIDRKHSVPFIVAKFISASVQGAAFTPRVVAVLTLMSDWRDNEHLMFADKLLKEELAEEQCKSLGRVGRPIDQVS